MRINECSFLPVLDVLSFQRFLGPKTKGIGKYLLTEFNSQWLPGLEIGPKHMSESIEMLKAFEALGYERVIATPFIKADTHNNWHNHVEGIFNEVKDTAARSGIKLRLDLAAKYMIDDGYEDQLEKGLLPVQGNKVLIQKSLNKKHPAFSKMLFKTLISNYKPILVHPERYEFWYDRKLKAYEKLVNKGVILQLSGLSLIGQYGPRARVIARQLLQAGLYGSLSTNALGIRDLKAIKNGLPLTLNELDQLVLLSDK